MNNNDINYRVYNIRKRSVTNITNAKEQNMKPENTNHTQIRTNRKNNKRRRTNTGNT